MDAKVALLVGGLGTRLRQVVASTAKPMASVGGRPFLELLLRQLSSQGFRRIVLCAGHRANDIETQLRDGRDWQLELEYSKESSPLGTAGALKFASSLLRSSGDVIVMNGDSFMELDLRNLLGCHRQFKGIATLAVIRRSDPGRYGTVLVDPANRVTGFLEKTTVGSSHGLVNAGVYVFNSRVLDFIEEGPASLERDVFPRILAEGIYAVEQQGMFIDIGTPEDYILAQKLADRLYAAATRPPPSCGCSKES